MSLRCVELASTSSTSNNYVPSLTHEASKKVKVQAGFRKRFHKITVRIFATPNCRITIPPRKVRILPFLRRMFVFKYIIKLLILAVSALLKV